MTKRYSLVILAYLALALALTYPLVLHFGDHVPGSATWAFDEYTFLWNFWWFKHAVFDLGVNPLYTNYIFYPIGVSLVLYTFTLLNAVLAIPVEFVFGYPAAANTLLLFSFVAAGLGTFLLARYLLRTSRAFKDERASRFLDLAAFTAGAVYAFTSSRFVYASLGHYNFVSSQYLPFFVFFLVKSIRETSTRNSVLAGIFAALAILVDTTYAVFIGLFSAVFLLVTWRARGVARGFVRRATLMVGVAFILASPLLVPSFIEIATAGYTLPGWGHAEKLLVDLVGLITPTSLHPLNRHWVQELDLVRQGTSQFVDVNTMFLGYATLALAVLGAIVFRKRLAVWTISAIVFTLFSLGPLLHINGQSVFDFDGLQVTFPMPFLLLHYIPFIKENRVPNRYGILAVLSLAVLVSFAIAWLSQKLKRKSEKWVPILASIFLLLILAEHLSIPLPLTDARVPEVYAQIAREPGDFAILSLPLGWRNSFETLGAEDTRTQYYQSVHGKRLLSGNTSRNPPFIFDYFDRVSLFHSLTQLELYHQVPAETLTRDRAEASRLVTFYDIRYVVINAATPDRLPYSDTRGAVIDYVQKTLPLGDKVYDRDGVIAYRVNQAPLPAKQQIDFGTDAAHLYQGEGWDIDQTIAGESANWANQQSARVLFPIRDLADYQIALRALPFTYPRSPAQTLELIVNGKSISRIDLKDGWQDYAATIPARVLRAGLNDLELKFGYAVRPRDVLPPDYAIGSTGVASPVDIEVKSGDTGSIKLNGREASPLGRGYNIVVVDPKTGRVVDSKVFNTMDDIAQSRLMTDFLSKIPDGMIVAVASQETAAENLGDRTVAGLHSLGGQIDPRQDWGRAYALIGVKGAPSGSAIEQWNDGSSFVSVGHNADERTLAAAVSSITIEK